MTKLRIQSVHIVRADLTLLASLNPFSQTLKGTAAYGMLEQMDGVITLWIIVCGELQYYCTYLGLFTSAAILCEFGCQ